MASIGLVVIALFRREDKGDADDNGGEYDEGH